MAEGTSRQRNIESVVLLVVMLLTVCNGKEQVGAETNKNVQFGEKRSIKKLNAIAKDCAGRKVVIAKEISTLTERRIFTGT